MSDIVFYLIPVFMIGVVIALALGLASFVQEGKEARRRSNRMMQWRIGLQFGAVALLLVFVLLAQA
ncbi:MAG: twin transmembrane helix small protein [Pseudomonadota bacterium]